MIEFIVIDCFFHKRFFCLTGQYVSWSESTTVLNLVAVGKGINYRFNPRQGGDYCFTTGQTTRRVK